MNDEIKKIFPKEFYINKKEKMVAEVSLENLNKIVDYITNLQQSNERAFELLQQLHYLFDDNDSIHERIDDIQKVLKGNDDK